MINLLGVSTSSMALPPGPMLDAVTPRPRGRDGVERARRSIPGADLHRERGAQKAKLSRPRLRAIDDARTKRVSRLAVDFVRSARTATPLGTRAAWASYNVDTFVMSRMPDGPHVTDTGKLACHGFWELGAEKAGGAAG